MIYERLELPELNIELYRNDDAVWRVLLSSELGTVSCTLGSPTVTVSKTMVLGYNLYTTNGELIGTVASVGSGTATLTSNATFTYSGVLKVGIDWEESVEEAVLEIVRKSSLQPLISLSLDAGLSLDGDWLTMDFTALRTTVRADRYTGDFRVKFLDGDNQTLFVLNVATIIQNRSNFDA